VGASKPAPGRPKRVKPPRGAAHYAQREAWGQANPRRAAPSGLSPLGGQRTTRSEKRGGYLLRSNLGSDMRQGFFHLVDQNQAQLTVLELVHGRIDSQKLTVDF
jgi:hypothetical protein